MLLKQAVTAEKLVPNEKPSNDKTAKLINNTLITNVENQNMSTLDVCDINLHTGQCTFLKVGATVSFIKRANYVEKITANIS